MTLVTQKASFGASRDDDPVGNDRTLAANAVPQEMMILWVMTGHWQHWPTVEVIFT
jgi:hypothetical protein